MKGVILGLEAENAKVIIFGHDDKRYQLPKSEWKSAGEPKSGMAVDFVIAGEGFAKEAYNIPTTEEGQTGEQPAMKVNGAEKRFKKLTVCASLVLVLAVLAILTLLAWPHIQLANLRTKAEKGDVNAEYSLGICYSDGKLGLVKDDNEAMKWYRKAAEQNVAEAEVLVGIDCVKSHDASEDVNVRSRYATEAIKWFSKAAEQNDGLGQLLLSTCYEHGEGVVQDIVEAYKWALLAAAYYNTTEQNSKLESSLSLVQIEEGKRRASVFLTRYGNMQFGLSQVGYRDVAGEMRNALSAFNKAIEIKPDFPDAYYGRGCLRYAQGNLNGALDDYEKAIEFEPDFAEAYNQRSLVKKAKGDSDGALADFNRAIKLKHEEAQAYSNLGYEKCGRGDLDGALADYKKAIELNPNDAEIYCRRGKARAIQGNLDGALIDLNRALKLNPNDIHTQEGINVLKARMAK